MLGRQPVAMSSPIASTAYQKMHLLQWAELKVKLLSLIGKVHVAADLRIPGPNDSVLTKLAGRVLPLRSHRSGLGLENTRRSSKCPQKK